MNRPFSRGFGGHGRRRFRAVNGGRPEEPVLLDETEGDDAELTVDDVIERAAARMARGEQVSTTSPLEDLEDFEDFEESEESDDEEFEWLESEDDPLVRRLRNLKWPEVRPELRERCWKAICERVEAQQAERERLAREAGEADQSQQPRAADGDAS